ncbi:aminoglycoside phosphotransferase family protein [Alisedimentitalea sp. MJ-SS2]|uniref:phosphotransferase family protein n=1 Tax=Aliisedimentitalea sp. MJ-SS2 TaxID=3049795 RepID=UPI0029111F07|nr:aminoglycoside phosphotransferase family protein [Alisedimentitalea sp. MJ-SS2]MDU8929617.1 aminoglycoside phosphotransferase family protein [Alisedimentitalea sp. MJ-SS2]
MGSRRWKGPLSWCKQPYTSRFENDRRRCNVNGIAGRGRDSPANDLEIKLFSPTPDNPLFSNDPAAEARLLNHLTGTGLAPRLHETLATPLGSVVLYTHVAGSSWRSYPAPVGRVLARLHRHPAPPDLDLAPYDSRALLAQGLDILDRRPNISVTERLRNLTPSSATAPSRIAALLHGDVVPGNVIQSPIGDITLIDWQCPAVGAPVHDLAIFLSPAMQHVYRDTPLSQAEAVPF